MVCKHCGGEIVLHLGAALYRISNVRWNSGGKLSPAHPYQSQFNNSIIDDGTRNYFNCSTDDLVIGTTAVFKSLKKYL